MLVQGGAMRSRHATVAFGASTQVSAVQSCVLCHIAVHIKQACWGSDNACGVYDRDRHRLAQDGLQLLLNVSPIATQHWAAPSRASGEFEWECQLRSQLR